MTNGNQSIKCVVSECTHHANTNQLCTLTSISVGKSDSNVNNSECTECSTFRLK
ncbi:DUF1540 domain-containing protein [Mycoplasmatota bacterium zrk1]